MRGPLGATRQICGPLGVTPMGGTLPCYYLTFDAIDDLVTMSVSTGLPHTIVCWIKRTHISAQRFIMSNGTTSAPNIFIGSTGRLVARVDAQILTAQGLLDNTNWNHLAVVHPGGVTNSILYINGVDVTNTTNVAISTVTYSRLGTTPGNPLDGNMAAIGIAPLVLNIAALYAAGTFHKPLDPATFTKSCWNIRNEGGSGTVLIDESATGNNGTFLGVGEPAWGGLMSTGGPTGWSDS